MALCLLLVLGQQSGTQASLTNASTRGRTIGDGSSCTAAAITASDNGSHCEATALIRVRGEVCDNNREGTYMYV